MFPRELIPHVLDYSMTGSRAIVSPPPMDTDEDWVVLIPGTSYIEFSRIARGFGFEMTSNGEYRQSGSNDFKAFRKGELNLIVTIQKSFFHRYVFAASMSLRSLCPSCSSLLL